MKNKLLKILTGIATIFVTLFGTIQFSPIQAASLSVTVNKSSVYVGDIVTFTVSASGVGKVNVSGAVSDTIWLENSSKSYTVTASSEGNLYIGASGVIADFDDGNDYNVSDACTVSVLKKPSIDSGEKPQEQEKPETQNQQSQEDHKNKDSALENLTVSKGTLEPKFNPETTSYKVNVDADTKSIDINASARDAKAKVNGTGTYDLKVGDNKIDVVGVAENGFTTTYTIYVHVDEKPIMFLTYKGEKLGVSRIPLQMESKLFEKKTIKINGKEVDALCNNALNITLITLEKNGKKDFYIYDTNKNEIVSIYQPIALCGENVAIIDIPQELQNRKGMKFTKVKVDKVELEGWTFNDDAFKNYALIYVMNDAGKKVYYQYEKTENTLQLYNDGVALTQNEYDKEMDKHKNEVNDLKMIIYGLVGLSIMLIIGMLVVSKKKKHVKKFNKFDTTNTELSKSSEIERNAFIDEDEKRENL